MESKIKSPEQTVINHDIMRYKKNKWAQLLALLGLAFNCLYFMLIYAYTGTFYYETGVSESMGGLVLIGVSVIITLVILLIIFLSSIKVQNYFRSYSYVLFAIAVFQILRIFGFPLYGLNHKMLTVGYFGFYPTADQSWVEFVILTVYLCASAGCLIASAVIGWIQATRLKAYLEQVEAGEVDVMAVIKKLDAQDSENAIQVISDPVVDEALKAVKSEEAAEEAKEAEQAPQEESEALDEIPQTNEEVE